MKTILYFIFFLAGFTSLGQETAYHPNRLIVKFREKVSFREERTISGTVLKSGRPELDRLNERFVCSSLTPLFVTSAHLPDPLKEVYVLQFSQPGNMIQAAGAYGKLAEVDYAEPDFVGKGAGIQGSSITPNDASFAKQWGLKNTGTFSDYPGAKSGADIDMTLAWDISTGDTGTVVAIIDSGCKLDHPEVNGRIWQNKKEISGNNQDDDNNGLVDDWRGWDYAYNDNDPTDDHGHGVNVTGIIGANGDNSIGLAGVNWKCKLMVLKGLDKDNSGLYSWWASALIYATDNGAKVVNMSLVGTSPSTTLQNAVTYAFNKNVLVVVAAGNENVGTPSYPAACTNAMAIGSTSPDDTRTSPFCWGGGSNYAPYLSVVAPGDYIYGLHHLSNTNYTYYYCGTSQATPHVAGLASLLLAVNPGLTPSQLRTLIEQTSEDQVGKPAEDVAGWDKYHGHGRINAHKAMTQLVTSMNKPVQERLRLQAHPNPATDRVRFVLPRGALLPAGNEYTLVLIDGTGREVQRQIPASGTVIELDASSLARGLHLYRIWAGKDQVFSGKILLVAP